ncbi:short chain dehydrogenase domain-containing protein [Ditylenchus destructor]|uniref:3-dehydrosphinganine reductase n=1 Tax=Ditylenchus destructor TaxID=166010 RepID=A0AAD4N5B1_9BILA|nr:short chain dehydrogenase domain-containing protein [Ditylenchus destructor]
MKPKKKPSKELQRLTIKLEFTDTDNEYFDNSHFEVLVNGAIKQVLGIAAPPYSILNFDANTLKGTIEVSEEHLNLIWSALSIYGTHFGKKVAVHLNSIYVILYYFHLPKRIRCDFKGKHVFITGGSKGIGKAIAEEVIARGCKTVSIAARSKSALESATDDLRKLCSSDQFVNWYPLDLSKKYDEIENVIKAAVEESGNVDILINNAGAVIQGGFDELDMNAFENQMRTNYLSAVYVTRCVIESMKKNRSGHVAFVSSAAGQCAIWGYTAYSPSKFALRGFAEALHMELLPFNVGVSILFPPNTNTEGFHEELKTMPEEIHQISHSAGVFSAKEVGSALVDNIGNGEFCTTVGLEGWMLGVLTAGAAPEPNILRAITQTLLAGILRGVMLIYNGLFNRIVHKCHLKKNKTE